MPVSFTALESSYAARVFPYFFYNERGTLSIEFTDEQLTRLDRGERVDFQEVWQTYKRMISR